MSEPKPLSDGDVEPYAKYHAERASDGGASAEFHARAETFLRAQAAKLADMEKSLEDVRADRDAALAELVGMKDHLIALDASVEDARKERDAALRKSEIAEQDARVKTLALGVDLEAAKKALGEARAELAAIQSIPEQEWADVSATIAQGLALYARKDQPQAKAMLSALDRGKVYVDNLSARLKPTGKVAEDERCVRLVLDDVKPHPDDIGTPLSDADSALSRLAAKAQGYEAAVADNAALLGHLQRMVAEVGAQETGTDDPAKMPGLVEYMLAAGACEEPHPGAALLEEAETLRQRQALWEEAANALYGYTVFGGPCAHGRHPWDRCDECGEESAVHALVKVNNALTEQHRKEVDALKQALESQRGESHTLRRAFLHERHRAEAAGAPPEHAYNARRAENLVADEHKALVRARNEGREQIASWLGQQWGEYELADRARAMKEPEE